MEVRICGLYGFRAPPALLRREIWFPAFAGKSGGWGLVEPAAGAAFHRQDRFRNG
jgi:hypothetical protein